MSKISDQTLQHYTPTGNERILCYQPAAGEDGYVTPLDIATMAVPYDTVAGVTYLFVDADAYRVKLFTNASAVAATIPTSLTVGRQYQGYQFGAGRVTLGFQVGVTVRWPKDATGLDCKITRAQNSPFSFGVYAANSVIVVGDLASS